MNGCRRIGAKTRERKPFKHIEKFDDMDSARRGRRHRGDLIAAIGAMQGRPLNRAVGFEILHCHPAPGRADAGDDFFRDRPFVESTLAIAPNRLQHGSEISLNEPVSARQRGSIWM